MELEINKINISDKGYPSLLKRIPDPPATLYFRGDLTCLKNNCFAIVGTRRCSAYGKEITMAIAMDLARAGLVIVSGLAPGIDTFSHLACLEANSRTVAVLGTGLDEKSIYPRENLKLSRKIIETGGCLISEYPAGTHGSKMTFPARNRIISGVSLGTLVVEAKYKSGALITANFARKQKRLLFAVPGDIHFANSQGPHLLIKTGAKLTENAKDILKEINPSRQNVFLFAPPKLIDNEEPNPIIEVLKRGPTSTDEIIEKTGLDPAVVISGLTILEINDKVRNLGGNTYSLKR